MKSTHFFKTAFTVIIVTALVACDPPAEHNDRSVPNTTCSVSAGAENYFRYEAAELAIQHLFQENNPDTAQVLIPNDYYHAYVTALGLVYDATSIPERDSVIDMQLICQWNRTHSIIFHTTGVPSWVDNWINNIVPTGNPTVDNAIADYNLTITESPFAGPMPWFIVESNQPVNGVALSHFFETLPGVTQAQPNTYYSFYSNLEGSFTGNVAHLIFYEGWGDCPAGCFGYHQWKFDVDLSTCAVSFVGYIP
jgi:hypothetical protein